MNAAPSKSQLPPEKKRRNLALAALLLLFVVVIYGVTVVKIKLLGSP